MYGRVRTDPGGGNRLSAGNGSLAGAGGIAALISICVAGTVLRRSAPGLEFLGPATGPVAEAALDAGLDLPVDPLDEPRLVPVRRGLAEDFGVAGLELFDRRLRQGRELLRARLARRGLGPPAST